MTRGQTGVSAALGGLVAAAAVIAGFNLIALANPDFDSLPSRPNPQLRGTVAYFDSRTGCVRAVAAAGTPSKEVYCLGEQRRAGEVGVDLAWVGAGELQLTMLRRAANGHGESYEPAWQRVVDVVSLEAAETSESRLSGGWSRSVRPTVDNHGNRLEAVNVNGFVRVSLENDSGTSRTLFEAQGHPRSYRLHSAFFSPDSAYVLSDDGGVLITTVNEPSVTMRLAPQYQGERAGGALNWFAVTEWDLQNGCCRGRALE